MPSPAISTTTDRAPTRYLPPRARDRCVPFANFMRGIQCSINPAPPLFDAPNLTYAAVYPVAMITKIILAQLLI